jgi:dipeptidyl aminopeptidase/acylaminoacyl peptidase
VSLTLNPSRPGNNRSNRNNVNNDGRFPLRLDRAAIGLIFILTILIMGLLLLGYRGKPQVRSFNWADRQVGAQDTALTLGFNRPMDLGSVEKNIKFFTGDDKDLKPTPVSGRSSWSGRKLFYTLDRPLPYGQNFQLRVEGGQDRFRSGNYHETMQPFQASFKTRDRSFAYIGAENEEEGRLVLFNLTQNQKIVLTPPNLVVFDFKPYPLGDRILFSATARSANPALPASLVEQELYTVTTGLRINTPSDDVPVVADAKQVTKVLDNREFQLLKFDLSTDGKTAVVQRVSRKNQTQSAPWVIRLSTEQPPEVLKFDQPTGDFLITPDSQALVVTQGQGISVVSLDQASEKQGKSESLSFLPKFGNVLGMSADGSTAAMLKFNTDFTRSLYLVNNQGTETEIFKTTGSILKAQFSANGRTLFCLLTELISGEQYVENPYIAAIDIAGIQKGQPSTVAPQPPTIHPLLRLADQRGVQMSLSPDDVGILLDQKVPAITQDGKPTQTSRLWLLPLGEDLTKPIDPVDYKKIIKIVRN